MLFFIIIGLLACLSLGGVVVKGGGKGEEVLGGAKEYELNDFSGWLKDNVVGGRHWENIKACMISHDACFKLDNFRTLMDYFVTSKRSKLTTIEIGCCKPPAHCGYVYVNSTNWKVPEKGLKSEDGDCKTWNNEHNKLCYNCDSCKAGYLALIMQGWRKIYIINAVLLVVLFVVFIVAACALSN